ncbi:MAG: DUF2911 domain-containing protein [Cyclobacteriaceae bacterium]|jgi:hypothetical protein|nr:DUF2911 domain-containing protein [Cyclobacteriaceae bacterium]
MKKFIIISAIGIVLLVILVAVVSAIRLKQMKSFSPEEIVTLSEDGLLVTVHYNRPFKKGRDIFGGLVPYGQVWRTGANEATIFETNKPLRFNGEVLSAGKYSLWTIPDSTSWQVIFNSETGQWGINSKGEANRNPSLDVLQVSAVAVQHDKEFEQFTIRFDVMEKEAEMVFLWDRTVAVVPFSVQ